jgi:hypothetical protein
LIKAVTCGRISRLGRVRNLTLYLHVPKIKITINYIMQLNIYFDRSCGVIALLILDFDIKY